MIIEEVEQLAAQMQNRAGEIETIVAALTSGLEATSWIGPDHDQFHSEWNSTHVPMLHNVKDAILEASHKATFNAQQQREASRT
jgi:hypothetical protein